MKVTRRGGEARLRFDRGEVEILDAVFDDFEQALDMLGAGDAVYDRLHPSAYEEAEDAAEFRELVGDEADRARASRIGECRAELAACGDDLRLADDAVQRWLVTLNDVRLAVGTRIGVSAEDDPDDPAFQQDPNRLVYHWLTWLQDALLSAVLR